MEKREGGEIEEEKKKNTSKKKESVFFGTKIKTFVNSYNFPISVRRRVDKKKRKINQLELSH